MTYNKTSNMMGITEERANELIREMRHLKIDCANFSELAERMELKGELAFKGFIFGRLTALNENDQLKKLLEDFL